MEPVDERDDLDGLHALDPQAVGAVYDRYFSAVYRYVRYRVGDGTVAEDISSEVFVRLLESCRAGRPPRSNVRAWLLSTSAHAVNDHFRKVYRHPSAELSDDHPDPGPDPAADVEVLERRRMVRGALVKLTDDQQDVLALRFGEGFSLEETATVMKKKVNAIKQLQLRALAALGRKMEESL